MDLVILYPDQDIALFNSFCENNNLNPFVLTTSFVSNFNCSLFLPGQWPNLDDQYNHYIPFLKSCQQEFVRILDWQHLINESLQDVQERVSKVDFRNIEVCQESIRAEDYRLPPFMENLIMISNGIFGQEKSKVLFEKNPFVFVPKIIQGRSKDLINLFEEIVDMRKKFVNPKLTASLVALNILCNELG